MTAVSTALTSTTRSQEPTGFLDRTIEVEGVSPVLLFLHGSGERGSDGILQTSIGLGEWLLSRDGFRRAAPARGG